MLVILILCVAVAVLVYKNKQYKKGSYYHITKAPYSSVSVPMRSIIVFSDRCTLKDITLKSADVSVINRYKVTTVVAEICNQIEADVYTIVEINDFYSKLYPYTQLGHEAKQRHIESIKKNREYS
jgi:hypothetical protein